MAENQLIETGRCVYAKGHLIGARSDALAFSALNAGFTTGVVGAIRNIGPEEVALDSIEMGFITTVAATAGFVGVAFAFYKVVGFTVLPATGARTTPPLPIRKRFGDHFPLIPAQDPSILVNPPNTFLSVSISGAAVLTGGTFTAPNFDDPMGQLICEAGANGVYTGLAKHEPRNGIPWALAPNEGIIFANQQALPTSLVGRFTMGVDARLA
jgi:hypothetical protein